MDEEHEEIASTLPKDLDALPRLGGFRLRGMEITRLETFIDAVFAFAITMLVIAAQQIPDDIETLLAASRYRPGFAARRSRAWRSEEHTSELQSLTNLVFRLLLQK